MLTRTLFMLVLFVSYLAQAQVREEFDPTRPVAARAQSSNQQVIASKWQVSAIFSTATEMRAVVNGQAVRPGESVDEAKVLSIEPSAVTILLPHTHQQHRLSLATSQPVKRNVSNSY